MKSKITGGETQYLFTADVLNKYPVKYYKCVDTGFIQTEEPHWLNEAYSSAITALDIGLLYRNYRLSDTIEKIIGENFNPDAKFIDYAGGYGIFTRLMRDKGYDFCHTDKFCENMFAKYFDLSDQPSRQQFELATAFELFEHLTDPLTEINAILKYTDTIIFSTELVPDKEISSPADWWYIAPETGQHIAFYTISSLQHIAGKLGLHLYSNNASIHILTVKKLDAQILKDIKDPFGKIKLRRKRSKEYYDTSNKPIGKKIKLLFKAVHEAIKELLSGKAVFEKKSLQEKDVKHIKELLQRKQS